MEEKELERIERDALHHSATIDARVVLRLVQEVRRLKGSRREYFAGLEMAADICENIYEDGFYAPGDWPTPEECAKGIRTKAKEIREGK